VDKIKAQAILKFNAYRVLEEKIEIGLAYGLRRCWKYTQEVGPSEERLQQMEATIILAIMNEVADIIETD